MNRSTHTERQSEREKITETPTISTHGKKKVGIHRISIKYVSMFFLLEFRDAESGLVSVLMIISFGVYVSYSVSSSSSSARYVCVSVRRTSAQFLKCFFFFFSSLSFVVVASLIWVWYFGSCWHVLHYMLAVAKIETLEYVKRHQ